MWWLARPVSALPSGFDWLAPAEADRAQRLRFAKRRTEYLLRRLVAKHAVSTALGFATEPGTLARIEVANAPSGAPYALLDGVPVEYELSLSDRAGWAVCVLAKEPVGGDLELVEPRSDAFLDDFLTGAEVAYVLGQPAGEARSVAANVVWSAKESALKVLRTGLRRDTRTVEVTVAGSGTGWSPLRFAVVDGPPMSGWWRRVGDYVFTVASSALLPPPEPLVPRPRSSASAR